MTAVVIAIDGPAASGKSSTAAAVATGLGLRHLDSGSLYRALTWIAETRQLADPAAIIAIATDLHVDLHVQSDPIRVHIDGVADPDAAIRTTAVTARVSAIAAMPALRDWVNARIRGAAARLAGVVVDGRDIGTIVFPDAVLKIYLTAAAVARAERRLRQRGSVVDPRELAAETAALAERDRLDTGRATAPLRRAADAVEIDTTAMTLDQQVGRIVALATARGITRR